MKDKNIITTEDLGDMANKIAAAIHDMSKALAVDPKSRCMSAHVGDITLPNGQNMVVGIMLTKQAKAISEN